MSLQKEILLMEKYNSPRFKGKKFFEPYFVSLPYNSADGDHLISENLYYFHNLEIVQDYICFTLNFIL